MKKSWPLLVLLPMMATMIYFLPDLVKVRQIQTRVVSRISTSCGCDLKMASMRWHWTPLPHLTLKKVRVKHSAFTAEIPKITLSPQWSALLHHQAGIGRVELDNPQITIIGAPPAGRQGQGEIFTPPSVTVVIKNGRISVDSIPAPRIKAGGLNCRNINGTVTSTADIVRMELDFIPTFAKNISLAGKFNPQDFTYSFLLNSSNFQLTKLLDDKNGDIFIPLDSTINFSIQAGGKGLDNFDLSINGELPDLAVKRLDKPARFDLAGGTLRLSKNGGNMSIGLLDVQANEPELTLNGSIERYFPEKSALPFWRLDLTAEETDLTAVGHDIMTVFADNKIARTVCNIVREAQIDEAHYVFDGPLADFNCLDKMLIEVDIATSTIYLPAPDLLLTRAAGPIVIKNGKLSGANLTARLNNSKGTNGSVIVGISKGLKDFYLDLDIDADINELPAALRHLIHLPDFQAEMTKFHGAGRANGHLTMGDALDDFTVKVAVTDMSRATVDYDRLSWRIAPTGGRLDISDQTARWTDFSAEIGPHVINSTNGSASWKNEAELAITSLDADLEPQSLFAELISYPVLAGEIKQAVKTISAKTTGEKSLHLDNAELHGPFFRPAAWKYQFSALVDDVGFTSPLLPDKVLIKNSNISFNQDQGVVQNCNAVFLAEPLNFNGILQHHYWHDWFGGRLTFNVILNEKKWDRLLEKNLVPLTFFPKVPCRLKDFTVAWEAGGTTINGAVIASGSDDSRPRADIYYQRKNNELIQFNCLINEKDKSGKINISHLQPGNEYIISWLGELDVATLNELFVSPFSSGIVNGTFALKIKEFNPSAFSGVGRIENLSCSWGDQQDTLEVKRLFIHGNGSKILLDDLELSLRDETIRGRGLITAMPGSLHLDIDCASPWLSWSTIDAFRTGLQTKTADKLPLTLTGRVNFDLAVFSYCPAYHNDITPAKFIWTPFKGILSLHDNGKKSFNIESSQLCGLDMRGLLEWHDGQGERRLTITGNKDNHDRFEELLPCLNVTNSSIEGRFKFNCALKGTEKEWTDGKFSLNSSKGNMRQMILLSNIFRVINFTDLLRDYRESGFPYSQLDIKGHVESNNIILDKARINGRGLDMLGEGRVNLATLDSDFTIYVIPLKTIDSVLNMVPVIGRAVGGRKGHIVTIPISISGEITDPEVNVMSAKAVGLSTLNWIGDTLLLPYDLFVKPFTDDEKIDQ